MEYTLVRSRRRTIAIHVKPDGTVEVRSPYLLSEKKIEQFIRSKLQWIEKKQKYFSEREQKNPAVLPPPQYAGGEFEQAARELASTWEQRLGVKTTYIGFREMSSRWGSCTSKTGRIRLSTLLAYVPHECLEYLIVHELAHIIECNHSPRFWEIVAGALPDYKARQKKLKDMTWLLDVLKN